MNSVPITRWSVLSNFEGADFRPFEEALSNLQQVLELARSIGLRTDSSRIWAYGKTLSDLRDLAAADQQLSMDLAMRLLCTIVELSELTTIRRAVESASDSKIWHGHLERILSGSHPNVPSKASPAWDFQFEAFVAAVTQLSGFDVEFAEPDFIVRNDTTFFAIAAKRPRGQGGIRRKLSRAAKQIQTTGIDGLIALDCSFAIANGRSLTTTTLSSATSSATLLVQDFIQTNISTIRSVNFGTSVVGIVFALHIPVTLVDDGWQRAIQLLSAYRWTVLPLIDADDSRLSNVLRFAERCQYGLSYRQPDVKA